MRSLLGRVPVLADFYRMLKLIFPLVTLPKRSVLGFKLVGAHPLQMSGKYEPEVADLLIQRAPKVERFINVGANIGYWPVMIRHYGFKGTVTLIEPDTFNLRILKRNLKVNSLWDIEILNYAANNSEQTLKLYGFGTGISGIKGWAGGFSNRTKITKSNRLDRLVIPTADRTMILIDVEGFELQVLEGAINHISGNSEFLVEILLTEHQPTSVQVNPNFVKIFELMHSYNYKIFSWVPIFRQLQIQEVASLMNGKIENKCQMYYFCK